MKIAVPVTNGLLSAHFGHCEQFAIIEADRRGKRVVNTSVVESPGHEPGVLPRWLADQGAELIIAGGMGQRAQQLFAENDIDVVVGAEVKTLTRK